jgi:hypothetical protein
LNGLHLKKKKTFQEYSIENDTTIKLLQNFYLILCTPSGTEFKLSPCTSNLKIFTLKKLIGNTQKNSSRTANTGVSLDCHEKIKFTTILQQNIFPFIFDLRSLW